MKTTSLVKAAASQKITPARQLHEARALITKSLEDVVSLLSNDLPPTVLAKTYELLNSTMEKSVAACKKAAREGLLNMMGEKEELHLREGTTTMSVKVVHPQASMPDDAALRQALKEKGLRLEDAYDKTVSFDMSKDKVALLVRQGHFTQEEIDELKKPLAPRLEVKRLT